MISLFWGEKRGVVATLHTLSLCSSANVVLTLEFFVCCLFAKINALYCFWCLESWKIQKEPPAMRENRGTLDKAQTVYGHFVLGTKSYFAP